MAEKTTTKKASEKEVEDKPEATSFTGKFIQATGRRKTASARVRLYEDGKGAIIVNGQKVTKYFPGDDSLNATMPLKLTSHLRDLNVSVIVRGGGKAGQTEAVRHGIARALLVMDESTGDVLKTAGLLTRDRRKVERKKPGLRKARKSPQWSKR
ncbi:MAG: 30S ribosomal protein S9 [Candidatus Falkowbacteria bacterium]